MFKTEADNLYIYCYREDKLGDLVLTIENTIMDFSELRYLKAVYFKEDERLKAYVHFNKLVSMFRDSKTYDS